MPLSLEFITTPERFAALAPEWNGLLPVSATNEVFLTWEWQHTWWEAYHPGDLWVYAARDEAGALAGIAPWFRDANGQVIRPIGCIEVTDYLDVIVGDAHREAFFAAIAAHLGAHAADFSRINLCNHPDGSPTLEALPRYLTAQGFSVNLVDQEVCPIIRLPGDFETYVNSLEKKQRHELRRKIRRAEADEAGVRWYMVGPEHDLQAEITRFTALMAASAPSKAQFLADPQNRAFFEAIVPRMAVCGWLQLSFLIVNEQPAAAYLDFVYNNRVLVYNSGLLPEPYGYLSPGIVLLARLIEEAIVAGRAEFDFLRGDEEYKYRMGGQDRRVIEIKARYGDAPEDTP